MEARNELSGRETIKDDVLSVFIRLTAPFAPHVSEELWHQYGGSGSVHQQNWPEYSEESATQETIDIAIQIDGNVRGELTIDKNAEEATVVEQAKQVDNVQQRLKNATVTRHIYVPEELVNFVTE